jgi:hypothetical protein
MPLLRRRVSLMRRRRRLKRLYAVFVGCGFAFFVCSF